MASHWNHTEQHRYLRILLRNAHSNTLYPSANTWAFWRCKCVSDHLVNVLICCLQIKTKTWLVFKSQGINNRWWAAEQTPVYWEADNVIFSFIKVWQVNKWLLTCQHRHWLYSESPVSYCKMKGTYHRSQADYPAALLSHQSVWRVSAGDLEKLSLTTF